MVGSILGGIIGGGIPLRPNVRSFINRLEVDPNRLGTMGGNIRLKPKNSPTIEKWEAKGGTVEALEKQLNINLPEDYKEFLVSNNGAKIVDGYFYVKDLNQEILMDVFYGIGLEKRVFNLEFWHQEYGDEIPQSSLLIGGDPGGGFILLINNGENDGIYYYDHSYFFNESSDENNTYLISRSFSLFFRYVE